MVEAQEVAPGSDEYNKQMADKFLNQEAEVDEVEEVPVQAMPEGGFEKFYDPKTGEYNWQNHAKELEYRLNQSKTPEEQKTDTEATQTTEQAEVNDIVVKAGLKSEDLEQQIVSTGDLSEDAYAALEKVGLKRDLVKLYVDNLTYRREANINEALQYVGGQQEWDSLSTWAADNLPETEVLRYNELLASNEWRVAVDALKVKRDSSNPEPRLVSGSESVNGSSYGYRSKSEMKSDMSDPRYSKDPAFRREVMQKIQSATWDLE